MVRFFIDRPVFAWVLAIVVMMAGALAITTLPVAQYPSIAPPAISIQVTYPGASAETVQSTVTQVIEQQLSGIDHLLYFGSESDKDGSMAITLYFEERIPTSLRCRCKTSFSWPRRCCRPRYRPKAFESQRPREISCWSSASTPPTAP
jgi:hypothetical protein